MLFMVIETFADPNRSAAAERFQVKGRMLPDGVVYQASWLNEDGSRCFQVMDAPSRQLLDQWIAQWNDLVEFEVIPVVTSAEYWEKHNKSSR
jgi:Protein of unknown function (DUF3303)